jgi:hypothetical protein
VENQTQVCKTSFAQRYEKNKTDRQWVCIEMLNVSNKLIAYLYLILVKQQTLFNTKNISKIVDKTEM